MRVVKQKIVILNNFCNSDMAGAVDMAIGRLLKLEVLAHLAEYAFTALIT